MNIYYWTGKRNFGDLLTPFILQRFTDLSPVLTKVEDAQLVMVGSILEHLPKNWNGVVAGCGKLHEKSKIDLPYAKFLAVRGPLTAKSIHKNIVLADPGLIADELTGYKDKEFDLGIVPHWSDTTLEFNPIFKKYNPKIIHVNDDPLKVIDEISRCKKIVSSSLHGIILADAFGIPRRIEIAPRLISHPHQEGGLFKWHDYLQSIGMKLEVGLTQEANRNIITEKQHELFDVLEEIKRIFSKNFLY